MQELFNHPPVVKWDPICRQVTEVNTKAFAGSMSVVEASESNQCLMNVAAQANQNVSLQFLVDIRAGCNLMHETTVRERGWEASIEALNKSVEWLRAVSIHQV